MLRAPEMYKRVLHPIDLYEGDNMGEGIVKTLRLHVWSGLRDGWTISLHKAVYRNYTLEFFEELITQSKMLNISPPSNISRRLTCKVKFYRYTSDVVEHLKSKGVLSISLIKRNFNPFNVEVGCFFYCKTKTFFVPLQVDGKAKEEDENGFTYFKTDLCPLHHCIIVLEKQTLSMEDYSFYCSGIALPSLNKNEYYSFLFSDGQKLVPKNSLGFMETSFIL